MGWEAKRPWPAGVRWLGRLGRHNLEGDWDYYLGHGALERRNPPHPIPFHEWLGRGRVACCICRPSDGARGAQTGCQWLAARAKAASVIGTCIAGFRMVLSMPSMETCPVLRRARSGHVVWEDASSNGRSLCGAATPASDRNGQASWADRNGPTPEQKGARGGVPIDGVPAGWNGASLHGETHRQARYLAYRPRYPAVGTCTPPGTPKPPGLPGQVSVAWGSFPSLHCPAAALLGMTYCHALHAAPPSTSLLFQNPVSFPLSPRRAKSSHLTGRRPASLAIGLAWPRDPVDADESSPVAVR